MVENFSRNKKDEGNSEDHDWRRIAAELSLKKFPTSETPFGQLSPPNDTEKSINFHDYTRPLKPNELADAGEKILQKIHPDGSPATKADLAKAMQDSSIRGNDAKALADLYLEFDNWSALSKPAGILRSKSIDKGALEKYYGASIEKQANSEGLNSEFFMDRNLTRLAGPDGRLHQSDIDKALADPKTEGADVLYLEELKKFIIKHGSDSPSADNYITKADLDANFAWAHAKSPEMDLVDKIGVIDAVLPTQLTFGDRELYRDKDPLTCIKPEAIKQGAIGDCYFEASLASVASSHPEIIRDSIHDNKNGTFTVTFPGAKDEPVTVNSPTEAEMYAYNRGDALGKWAAVMEKAFGKYKENLTWFGTYTPQDAADGGGWPKDSLKLLTGSSVRDYKTANISQKDLADHLQRAFAGPHLQAVVATSNDPEKANSNDDATKKSETIDGFASNHAFTVTGFISDGKGGGTVQMLNPWGLEDGSRGRFEIPLSKFVRNFYLATVTESSEHT